MLSELTAWLHQLPSSKVGALRVACIGNSITEGYGIPMASQNGYPAVLQSILGNGYLVKNFGVSSRTMLNKGDYPYMKEPAFRDALDFCPDVAIVKLGTNDSKPENWRYGSELAADMQTLIDSLKALPSKPKIFLTTPIPAFKSTWNISDSVITTGIIPVIRKLAKKNKCVVIDLHTLFSFPISTKAIHPQYGVSSGPNSHAKGPHLDSHSARMSFQPWPFQKVKGLLRENIPAVTRL